ncbi:hypothetical protein [Allosphingosinicella deserti]|nr:hypothetical protein [Sphingomonas deserti]
MGKRRTFFGSLIGAAIVAPMIVLASTGTTESTASKENWVEIGVAGDGTRAEVDQLSITGEPRGVALRQRFLRNFAGSTEATEIEQWVIYDCGAHVVHTVSSDERAKGGTILRADRFSPPEKARIRPGSLPALIYNAVC